MTLPTPLSDAAVARLRQVADLPDVGATRYEILGTLGRGGMATVYLARDRELEREVALKVIDTVDSSAAARTRMQREARTIAALEHPGIVPVHDVGTLQDGRVFYAMQRVSGRRLDQLDAATPLGERLRIFVRVCEAVAFCHVHGVLHLDLKPQNVMTGAFGEVLVMDWGLARLRDAPAEARGGAFGTPGYMAPEQEQPQDAAVIDERADVYALGGILAHLLAGGEAPKRLLAIARKAAAASPAQRYPSASALLHDVTLFGNGAAVSAYRENPAERALRWLQRYRLAVGLIAAYLIARLVFLLFMRAA
jgi:serine/threonine protein kinase